MKIEVVAETMPGQFADFRPYVPAIDDLGRVAFQAKYSDGSTGVVWSDGSVIAEIEGEVISHPDFNLRGEASAYVNADGSKLWKRPQGTLDLGFHSIGPLGPTMNEQGEVAFRGERRSGVPGIFLLDGLVVREVAEAGAHYSGFQGLPVVNARSQVAFRADLADDAQGVFLWEPGKVTPIVTTHDQYVSLGNFPSLNDGGDVVFAGTLEGGLGGIFMWDSSANSVAPLISNGFESYRGALIDNHRRVALFATPVGGQLGLYFGDPSAPVLAIGASLLGSTVAEFALNSVSINNSGQLAVRVALEDHRQLILRVSLPSQMLA